MKLRVVVFAYDFPHKKTCEGLVRLFLNRVHVISIIAAPKVLLPIPQRILRVTERGVDYTHPRIIAERYRNFGKHYGNAHYHSKPHTIKAMQGNMDKWICADLGIILGARILPKEVIDLFPYGILNMHPGLLPENRGLDTIEWAALKGIPQGVTTHLIDQNIDRGTLIDKREIKTYPDDTALDIWLRLQSLQLKMMIEAIERIESGEQFTTKLGTGMYHKYMGIEDQEKVREIFSPKYETA